MPVGDTSFGDTASGAGSDVRETLQRGGRDRFNRRRQHEVFHLDRVSSTWVVSRQKEQQKSNELKIAIVLAQAFMPEQSGGSQTSALELAIALSNTGDDVVIVCELLRLKRSSIWPRTLMFVTRRPYLSSTFRDRLIWRVHRLGTSFRRVMTKLKPDVVLFQAMEALGLAHQAQGMGLPCVVYWRDAQSHRMGGETKGLRARYLANSEFTSSFYEKLSGVRSKVIPPLIEADRYRASNPTRDAVVFIGLFPEKGGDLAFAIARSCPDIPFLFVESWVLHDTLLWKVLTEIATLPNVRLVRHQSDMRPIYARARVVLVPSQWPEAWGRVASEAHLNGIPVLASRVGGLPEAVGPGGLLLDHDAPVDDWVAALRRMWGDAAVWSELSDAALRYAAREQLQPSWQIGRLRDELAAAIDELKPTSMPAGA